MNSNPGNTDFQLETPVEETPPVESAPDEQLETEETPAEEANPEVEDAGAIEPQKHEKTPEQIAEDARHWQAESQKAKAQLKALQESSGPTDESSLWNAPTPAPVIQPSPRPGIVASQQPQQSPEEFAEQLRQDPLLQAQLMGAYVQDVVKTTLVEERKAESARLAFESEDREAKRVLRDFRDANRIPDEAYKAAFDHLKAYGIKGRPAAIAGLLIDKLNYDMAMGNIRQRTTQVEAETSAKIKAQQLTTQPVAGGIQPKSKKPGESLADLIAPRTVS